MSRHSITALTPAEFMLTRDSDDPDVQTYHLIVDSILDRLTQLCNEVEDPVQFRNGIIDVLITFDTQPIEH